MKKIIPLILLALALQSKFIIAQQICKDNLLTNPKFSSGVAAGWSQLAYPAVWIKLKGTSCIDTFVLIGGSTNSTGALAQDVAITASGCYNLCLCLASDFNQYCNARVYAATNDTSLTSMKLANNTFAAGSAQLIYSVNINGVTNTYCKTNWIASKNFTRIIIINTPQAGKSGAELHVDNVCLTACTPPSNISTAYFDELKIMNSDENISVTFGNSSFDCDLLDITGKAVREFSNTQNAVLSKSELKPGIYIIRVVKDGRVYTEKVLF